jgi:hypothetical protein
MIIWHNSLYSPTGISRCADMSQAVSLGNQSVKSLRVNDFVWAGDWSRGAGFCKAWRIIRIVE